MKLYVHDFGSVLDPSRVYTVQSVLWGKNSAHPFLKLLWNSRVTWFKTRPKQWPLASNIFPEAEFMNVQFRWGIIMRVLMQTWGFCIQCLHYKSVSNHIFSRMEGRGE
jgi:hypothetical protein